MATPSAPLADRRPWSEAEVNLLRSVIRARQLEDPYFDCTKIATAMNGRARDEGISDRIYTARSVETRYKKIYNEFALRIVRKAGHPPESPMQTEEMSMPEGEEAGNSALEQGVETALPCALLEAVEPSIDATELPCALMSDLKRRDSDYGKIDWETDRDNENHGRAASV